jgi:solute carrier family 25 uncoupling protein 8/9
MVRAAMLTAAQCVTYDEVKLVLKRQGWQDDLATHLVVSGIAGLVTTTITAPVDMVKTNVFVNRMQVWDCVVDIYKRFGVKGFFRGWGATWARQGPMTTVVFVVNEALRPVLGLQAL